MFNVFADASVKNNTSVHSYCIFNNEGTFIFGDVFEANYKQSTEAETYSIEQAINKLKQLGIVVATIYTDNSQAIEPFCKTLNNGLKIGFKYELKWISRNDNQLADLACTSGDSNFYEKNKKLVTIWGKITSFVEPEKLSLNHITPMNVSKRHKEELVNLYRSVTGEPISINEIFDWCKGRKSFNSMEGRNYLIGQLAKYNYFTSDYEKRVYKKIRNKTKLVTEAATIQITESAYQQYVNQTKKNKNITLNQAKRKLYRNIQLAFIDKCCKRTKKIVYHYGDLKIIVKENTIQQVEKCSYTPKGWQINRELYNTMNKILGIMY